MLVQKRACGSGNICAPGFFIASPAGQFRRKLGFAAGLLGGAAKREQTNFFRSQTSNFRKKNFLIFDLFVHFACLNSRWGVRISDSLFGNYMSRLLGPKTVVFSKAFGRHTRQTATIPRVQKHASLLKKVPVGQEIFVPEAFLLPDPQATFVANSDMLRDCSAA